MLEGFLELSIGQRALASARRRSGVDAALDQLVSRIERAESTLAEVRSRIEAEELRSSTELADLRATLQPAAVWADLLVGLTSTRLAPLSEEPLISVVLPTRNRPTFVRRAIDSVIAQTYRRWEVIVVNDGGCDATGSVIEELRDRRVRLLDNDGSGSGRARNVGLQAAAGSVVAFLDDDNVMAPDWLRAVAVTFAHRPELNAVYGAQLRSSEREVPSAPLLMFESPFDFERLMQGNFIDLGTVAHRSGLEGLAFDESLKRLIDWDYVVRLADRFGIEPLPVIASFYATDAPMRISHRGSYECEAARVRSRLRRAVRRAPNDSSRPAVLPTATKEASEVDASLQTRGSTKAWMTSPDADLLEEILSHLATRFAGRLRVLEWGSGLSTLYFPQWLASRGVEFQWTTLEYDRELFRRSLEPTLRQQGATIFWSEDLPAAQAALRRGDRRGITAVVFDEGPIVPFDANPARYVDRAVNLDDYVALPTALRLRFHAVIVDGRKRRRCLEEAASLLEEGGVAILHDAQRPYYRGAFAAFRSGRRVGDELWIGTQSETDFSGLVPPAGLDSPGFDYMPGT